MLKKQKGELSSKDAKGPNDSSRKRCFLFFLDDQCLGPCLFILMCMIVLEFCAEIFINEDRVSAVWKFIKYTCSMMFVGNCLY